MFPLARSVAARGSLGCYYSGYPRWKLGDAAGMAIRTHCLRTNVVYGLLKFVPERFRPGSRSLFLWQDRGFDRWVGLHLQGCDYVHGLPGQCLETFRAARKLGIQTVLSHATGPVREWVRIMEPEYARVGLHLEEVCPYDAAYFDREEEEYALAAWHCAASTVVQEQLISCGVSRDRIWRVPYGAVPEVFHAGGSAPSERFQIVFAGQVGLRKGLRTLLEALQLAGSEDWEMEFCGATLSESRCDVARYTGAIPLHFRGPLSQHALAEVFRAASVLVLPSLEEGFGLVVPQALNCGLPVVVSDRVGAKDLVRHRENGSIFPVGNYEALLQELRFWESSRRRPSETWGWDEPARTLLSLSEQALP